MGPVFTESHQPDKSKYIFTPCFFKIFLHVILPYTPGGVFLSGFPTKAIYALPVSLELAT
jgi:hypothetical protein